MPRKRTELDRDEKVEQILDYAVGLLRNGGHEELSVNRIARDLGLSRAAVYWYFPSRDELFTAACARLFADAFSGPPARGGVASRIRWGVDRFAAIYDVYAALLERAPTEQAAADLLRAFDQSLCRRLTDLLAPHVAADQLDGVVETIVVFVEGLLGRRLPAAERNRRLTTALDVLVPEH
ncbi:TetR/AcrR family transcriptional regulator [Amycolatopsis acidicola]|uniref:TetR/AcrR family transcriptional regulator n=1 Tax=Amycolatopsis acidicola TaxID=2596893 RepID=A0A5N0UT48_9PSEU|nr:TetR/AcrR family transcriptional regulator [Amycolatopsis acidicola]KAA9152893.1 TetR/AcrR family transcriptional regulator [Amycolatopsis acidicola]